MSTEPTTQPTFEVRPHKIKVYAWILAAVLVIGHTAVGFLLKTGGDTGVHFRVADQVGMALIGVILACAVLLFTRPRLRLGPDGVSVRNLLGDNTYSWDLVQDITFPAGSAFAHLELPQDEYVGIWAIQARDGEPAAAAMDRVRELSSHYRAM